MSRVSINTAKSEITFNYKLLVKWLCKSILFTILAYLICCAIVYRDCYISHTVSPVNHNIYIYVFLISLIGVIIALVVNRKNILFKLTLGSKISVDFKQEFRFNLLAILSTYACYYLLLKNTKLLYLGGNLAYTILSTDVKSEALKTFLQIAIPPDAVMVSCMVGMFLFYSLTRYLFDKSILE